MKLIIKNQNAKIKGRRGVHAYSDVGEVKNGFAVCDENDLLVGVAYISDDSRKPNYKTGTQILFTESFEKRHNAVWHTAKEGGQYLSYDRLKSFLDKTGYYTYFAKLRNKRN